LINNLKAYGASALLGEAEKMRFTPEGGRNDQLVRSAFKLGQLMPIGAVSLGQILDVLGSAAQEAGLPNREILYTIRNGAKAGRDRPRMFGHKTNECKEVRTFERDILSHTANQPIRKNVYSSKYIYDAALIETRLLMMPFLPATQCRVLVCLRRAVLTGSPKVVNGFTCIVQTEIAEQAGISRDHVRRCLYEFAQKDLLMMMPDPPQHHSDGKHPKRSTYIILFEWVIAGAVDVIAEKISTVESVTKISTHTQMLEIEFEEVEA
jgi:hypothetical protein